MIGPPDVIISSPPMSVTCLPLNRRTLPERRCQITKTPAAVLDQMFQLWAFCDCQRRGRRATEIDDGDVKVTGLNGWLRPYLFFGLRADKNLPLLKLSVVCLQR